MWTGAFWKATAERTIGTAAEAAIGVLVVVTGFDDIPDAAWWTVAVAAAVTVLKALATQGLTGNGPGLGGAETLVAPTARVSPPAGA